MQPFEPFAKRNWQFWPKLSELWRETRACDSYDSVRKSLTSQKIMKDHRLGVVGGVLPTVLNAQVARTPLRYVRLRPRASLATILDEHPDQALPEKLNGLISKMTVETLNLRPDVLVNVTPGPAR
jgi:hypothetical protein